MPLHCHDARRAGAPLYSREQRIHSQLAHFVLVEDFDPNSELRQPFGLSREGLGVDDIRRLGNEVAS